MHNDIDTCVCAKHRIERSSRILGNAFEHPFVFFKLPVSQAKALTPLSPCVQVDGVNIQGLANQDVMDVLRHAGHVVHLTLVRRKMPAAASPPERPSERGRCPHPLPAAG